MPSRIALSYARRLRASLEALKRSNCFPNQGYLLVSFTLVGQWRKFTMSPDKYLQIGKSIYLKNVHSLVSWFTATDNWGTRTKYITCDLETYTIAGRMWPDWDLRWTNFYSKEVGGTTQQWLQGENEMDYLVCN